MSQSVNEIGVKIKELRTQHQMSQDELAEKLSVTRQAVSNWERGKTLPDITMAEQLAAVFALSMDELILGKPQQIQNQYSQRGTAILFLVNILQTAAFLIYMAAGGKTQNPSDLILTGVVLVMTSFIFFGLGYAVKNNDFSLLAGYDPNTAFNLPALKKMLCGIRFHIVLVSLITTIIMTGLLLFSPCENAAILVFGVYLLDYIGIVLLSNYRNRNNIYLSPRIVKKQSRQLAAAVAFIMMLLICIGTMIFCMEYFSIPNHSPEASRLLVPFFPALILTTVIMLLELNSIKRNTSGEKPHPIRKTTWIGVPVVLILLGLMVWTAAGM